MCVYIHTQSADHVILSDAQFLWFQHFFFFSVTQIVVHSSEVPAQIWSHVSPRCRRMNGVFLSVLQSDTELNDLCLGSLFSGLSTSFMSLLLLSESALRQLPSVFVLIGSEVSDAMLNPD